MKREVGGARSMREAPVASSVQASHEEQLDNVLAGHECGTCHDYRSSSTVLQLILHIQLHILHTHTERISLCFISPSTLHTTPLLVRLSNESITHEWFLHPQNTGRAFHFCFL